MKIFLLIFSMLLCSYLNGANVTIKNATTVFPDTGSNFSSVYSDLYYNNNIYAYETSDASLRLIFCAISTDSSIIDGSVITWASYNDLFAFIRPILIAEISTIIQLYFTNYSYDLDNDFFVYNFNINTPLFVKESNFLRYTQTGSVAFYENYGSTPTLFNTDIKIDVIFDGDLLYYLISELDSNANFNNQNYVTQFHNNFTSSIIDNPNSDDDGDTLSNFDELVLYNTNPSLADSDSNGLTDYEELQIKLSENLSEKILEYTDSLNLHSLSSMTDLRAGSTMIEIHEGQATLTMEIEQSDDLGIWTTGGASTLQIPIQAGEGKKFFRFKMTE